MHAESPAAVLDTAEPSFDAPVPRVRPAVAAPTIERPLVRSAFHLVLGQGATTLMSIVATGAIGRSLGAVDFGRWYLLSTIAGFACVLVDWGYAPYVTREVARRSERSGAVMGTVFALRSVTVLLVCAPAAVLTWTFGYGGRMAILSAATIVSWLPMLLLYACTWAFRGRERMDFEALATVLLKALLLVFTVALVAVGRLTIVGLLIVQAAAGAVALAWALTLYRRLGLRQLQLSSGMARELVLEAAPFFTMSLMISVQPYVDANLLGRLAPAAVVGWYGATAAFTGTLLAPAVILGSTVYPRLARTADDPSAFGHIVREALRPVLLIAALGAVGTYAFGDFAVALVYKHGDFLPAGAILRAFSPNLLLVSIDVLLGHTILAAGRIRLFARAKVVAVVVTGALELVMIPWFQMHYGNGGIAVMLAFTAGELVLIVTAVRIMPTEILTRHTAGVAGRVLLAAITGLLTLRICGALPPVLGIAVLVAAYGAAATALGLLTRADVASVLQLVAWRGTSQPEPAIAGDGSAL
jgi:O-antigen/teichoic acid export membrane protein